MTRKTTTLRNPKRMRECRAQIAIALSDGRAFKLGEIRYALRSTDYTASEISRALRFMVKRAGTVHILGTHGSHTYRIAQSEPKGIEIPLDMIPAPGMKRIQRELGMRAHAKAAKAADEVKVPHDLIASLIVAVAIAITNRGAE